MRVAGTLMPRLTLSDLHATYAGTANPVGRGAVTVRYDVVNPGNVDLAVHGQQVTVSGLVADSHDVRLPDIQLLLPGADVAETVVVGGVWPQVLLHTSVSAVPVVSVHPLRRWPR